MFVPCLFHFLFHFRILVPFWFHFDSILGPGPKVGPCFGPGPKTAKLVPYFGPSPPTWIHILGLPRPKTGPKFWAQAPKLGHIFARAVGQPAGGRRADRVTEGGSSMVNKIKFST